MCQVRSLSQESFSSTSKAIVPTGKELCPRLRTPDPTAGHPVNQHVLSPGTPQHNALSTHNPTSNPALPCLLRLSKFGISKKNFPGEVKLKGKCRVAGPGALTDITRLG